MNEEITVPEWAKDLPEELRTNEAILRTKDVESLAKRVVDLSDKQTRAINLPGDDADASTRASFDAKLKEQGYERTDPVPETPDEYEVDTAEIGLEPDMLEAFMEERRKHYHSAGVGKRNAEKYIKADAAKLTESAAAYKETSEKAAGELASQFSDPKTAIANINKAAARLGIADHLSTVMTLPDGSFYSLGNETKLMDALQKIGAGLGEDKTAQPTGDPGTPEDLSELKSSRDILLSEYSKIPMGDPAKLAKRKELQQINTRIAAMKTGVQATVGATPERIAKALSR